MVVLIGGGPFFSIFFWNIIYIASEIYLDIPVKSCPLVSTATWPGRSYCTGLG